VNDLGPEYEVKRRTPLPPIEIRNPNLEIRNKSEIRMTESQKLFGSRGRTVRADRLFGLAAKEDGADYTSATTRFGFLSFEHSNLFRISNFEFRISN
jgi:hypothetical protein